MTKPAVAITPKAEAAFEGSSPLELVLNSATIEIVSQIQIPAREARYRAPPAAFQTNVLRTWIHTMVGSKDLRHHQSVALQAIAAGDDVVVATATASGKSFIFQAATIRELLEGRGLTLALYPLKALAADQCTHWIRSLDAAGLPRSLLAEINGDTPMNERADLLNRARIIVATPDVIHSWLMRQVATPAVRGFLARLRYLVIDEAHALEGELGSNCAYLMRRIAAAQARAQRFLGTSSRPVQIIGATATIANPADHMHRLTGRHCTVVADVDNGAPAAERTLLHVDGPAHGAGAERFAADVVRSLTPLMGTAAVIVFHDSRQGVERITRLIGRDDVLPYRSGYEASDRRQIEVALRNGTLRGVVATSALELGIDIPQFAIGLTIGVPSSRKTFQQRAGRVGRTRPGLFAVIAPAISFAQLGSSLEEFQAGEAEQSSLYLDNASIQFAQARCLLDEIDALDGESGLPSDIEWPDGFARMLEMAKPGAARPRALDMIAAIGADGPHLNYPLRHVCETNFSLKDLRGSSERFGTIGHHQAIREAYPGATYFHLRQACKIREWRSTSFDRSIRLEHVRSAEPTLPLLRKQVNASRTQEDVIEQREMAGDRGYLGELQMQIYESVEGFRTARATLLYKDLRKTDARMTRKQRDFASTGVLIQISEPWFAGSSPQHIETRRTVARAFKEMLTRDQCVQSKDIDFAETCVAIQHPSGPVRVDDAICIYDTIYGSLRLSAPLFDRLPVYIDRLGRAADVAGEDALLPSALATKLQQWFEHLSKATSPAASPAIVLKAGEYQIFAPGSEVGVISKGQAHERRLLEPQLLSHADHDVVMYRYESSPGVNAWVPHEQLQATGQNWKLAIWTPCDGQIRALEAVA
ncbi:DEAD/DEAH box helicase [Sphingomonas sp. Tas61C01]|uniref:DEAD/DEAH box helicase n=1 Tax=Sphingomonas sp. Tas61C01 TaxID=3458297 RepID=UPI00403E483F